MNVSTGMRNPFTIHDMAVVTTRYFRERPLPDEDGLPVAVPEWRLSSRRRGHHRARPRGRAAREGPQRRRPLPDPAQRQGRAAPAQGPAQGRPPAPAERDLLALRRARLRVRRPQHARAARRAAPRRPRALQLRRRRDRLGPLPRRGPPAGAARDRRAARGRAEEDALAGPPPAPEGPPALAIFDVEGVVLDSTVAHFYAWLRTRDMPELDKLVWTAGVATRVPGWIMEDRRSRTAFNRNFYRLYKDLPARELRRQAQRGAAGLHPAADPARGRAPDPPAQAPRRPRDPDHRRARLPRRVAAAPRRRADRGAARGAHRPLHRRAGRAAADRRRPREPRGAARRRPRRRPRRLPRLRRQPRRPAAARAGRPPARDQPRLPAEPRGAPPALADRDAGRRRRAAV